VFPLPITLSFFVILVSFFQRFWEGVLAGIFLDSLYFSPVLFSKFSLGFFTISFVAIILLMGIIKHFIQGTNFISKLLVAASGGLLFYFFLFIFF
jgi:uncharacterized membrane protein